MTSMSSHQYSMKMNVGPSTTMANYIPISIQLFLCLVLLSSRACNARPLGAPLSCKKDLDCLMNKSVLPAAQPIVSNSMEKLSTERSNLDGKRRECDPPKAHPPAPPLLESYVEAESRVSVPWRVPHNKIGEERPHEFNLDYDPPRTHPPIHN
uniref:Uncharacterized protein n=2 Tax=Daucus carota subsp. sativus TaxID=79200 RepID=A0A175YGD6_DAUCS|nr:PREDICTED: uncharacterized protein LOC108202249 isoform X1 [Daucus carota subsp. sativus]